jgi:hypothetical protein
MEPWVRPRKFLSARELLLSIRVRQGVNMIVAAIQYNDCFSEKWIRYLSPPEWRDIVSVKYMSVDIHLVEHAGCLTDPDVVQGWIDTIAEGRPVPPPVASITERGTYYLHDGNHRHQALLGTGAAQVRLAIILPKPGYAFVKTDHSEFFTYELRPRPTIPKVVRILTAVVLACALAILLTRLTPGTDSSPFFVILIASVVICVRWCGFIAGILATMINVVCAAYLLLPPVRSLRVDDSAHLAQLLITALAMLLITTAMAPNQRFARLFQRLRR